MRPSRSNRPADRQRSERAGRRFEAWAALYLTLRGFWIVARRLRTPVGEIDLVARRGRLLVFAEVKARTSAQGAADVLSGIQTARIRRAAQWYLMAPDAMAGVTEMRFDVIVMRPFAWPHHIENAC